MWDPAFHRIWTRREAETEALKTLPDMFAYACDKHLSYVVRFKHDIHEHPEGAMVQRTVFENPWFIVLDATKCQAGGDGASETRK